MNKRYRFIGIIFWIFCGLSLRAQSVNRQPNAGDPQTLRKLAGKWEAHYRENRQKALQLARKHQWVTKKTYANGRTIALQGLDERGQPVYYTTTNNIIAAATTNTNQLYAGGPLGLSLSGGSPAMSGRLGLWDDGSPRLTHQELTGRVTVTDGSTEVFTHSTHVAGTLIATGVNPIAKGMAFRANLKANDFNNDVAEMTTAAANGMLISNHSYSTIAGWDLDTDLPGNDDNLKWRWYGDPSVSTTQDYKFGFYGTLTQQWDQLTYNAPYYLPVKSAGNNRGSDGPTPGTPYYLGNSSTTSTVARAAQDGYDLIPTASNAKNILTVGAVYPIPNGYQNPNDVQIAPFSSWGPTDDGRIKPDIVGDGVTVTSCTADADNSYGTLSGTSMSSPNVAGSLLLLQELYNNKNSSAGTPQFMRAATLKGLVIHTANEAGDAPGPDYIYGWGLLNAAQAARVIQNTTGNHLITERTLNQGETYTYQVIASGNGPLTATISWTDPEGQALQPTTANLNNVSPRLVNDLDLRISDGTNTTLPWILDPANPANPATQGDNIRDNVEKIVIANTVAGKTYTITVTHKGTLQRAPQAYSLLVSGVGTTTYCASSAQNSANSRISNVTFGGINNTPPAGCATYRDYTNLFASIGVGQETPIPLSVTLGTCGSNVNKIAKVYLDWNGDRDFTDPNDLVATSGVIAGTGTFTANVFVPNNLTLGNFTRMRVVCVETSNPSQVNSCGTYPNGETEDYSVQFVQRTTDVGAIGVLFPEQNACPTPRQGVTVVIGNYGSASQTNIPVTTVISDANGTVATLSSVYQGVLEANEEGTVQYNGTFNAVAGRQYTFTTTTYLPGDQKPSNNSNTSTVVISELSQPPTITAAQCGNNPVTLKGDGNGTVYWYDAPTAGNLVAIGDTAFTTTVPPSRTYYGAVNDFQGTVGVSSKAAFASGGYNQFSPSVLITTQVPLVLQSARLYVGNSGKIAVAVETPDGTVVSSVVLDVTATRNPAAAGVQPNDPTDTGAVYFLNLEIPQPGNYQLTVEYGEGATLFRNNNITPGAAYPYSIPGVMAITGNTASTSGGTAPENYYYYFYNLNVGALGCPSPRVAANLSTGPALSASISASGKTQLCQGEQVVLQASTASDYTYQWYLNEELIPGATQPSLVANQTGDYVVVIGRGNCLAVSNRIPVLVFTQPIISLNGSTLITNDSLGTMNQWLLNGVVIPGATRTTYTPTVSGIYSLRASLNGCPELTSNQIEVIVTDTTNLNAGLALYPNPTTDILTITYQTTNRTGADQIYGLVYNSLGALVTEIVLQEQYGQFVAIYDATMLAAGVYYLRLFDGQNITTKAFVKL